MFPTNKDWPFRLSGVSAWCVVLSAIIFCARSKVSGSMISTTQLAEKQKELADYQAETIKVIRGESRLDIDLLNDLVGKAKQEIRTLTATVDAAKLELEQHMANSDLEQQEYEKIKNWADLYDTCTFAAKKMIISEFNKKSKIWACSSVGSAGQLYAPRFGGATRMVSTRFRKR